MLSLGLNTWTRSYRFGQCKFRTCFIWLRSPSAGEQREASLITLCCNQSLGTWHLALGTWHVTCATIEICSLIKTFNDLNLQFCGEGKYKFLVAHHMWKLTRVYPFQRVRRHRQTLKFHLPCPLLCILVWKINKTIFWPAQILLHGTGPSGSG